MRTACLLGNGVSIPYSQNLEIGALTASIMERFRQFGATDPGEALSGFADSATGSTNGFEQLLGPLDAVSRALPHLAALEKLAPGSPTIGPAISATVEFLKKLHRAGVSAALEQIAACTLNGNYEGGVTPLAAALADLGEPSDLTIGTLNYDGLLHAGLIKRLPPNRLCDMANGRPGESRGHILFNDSDDQLCGHPLRARRDYPDRRAKLVQLHGSLGWLRNPSDQTLWAFDIPELRNAKYWERWRAAATDWSPVVVLTDRKDDLVAEHPFDLGYRTLLRALVDADRWLIAGYGMNDTSVNGLFDEAQRLRTTEHKSPTPPVLVLGFGETTEALRARAIDCLALKGALVTANTAGIPTAFGSTEWRTWATAHL